MHYILVFSIKYFVLPLVGLVPCRYERYWLVGQPLFPTGYINISVGIVLWREPHRKSSIEAKNV